MISIKKKMKPSLMALCLLLAAQACEAQAYRTSAPLDTVRATGFYSILIDPILSAYAVTDKADIRISSGNSYVPYIIRGSGRQAQVQRRQRNIKLLSAQTDKQYTTIILKQDSAAYNYGISLAMAATAVERYAQISGSYNSKDWYIINDRLLLRQADGGSKGSYEQYIQLPGNNYTYYKLKIDNAHTDPLHVSAASVFKDSLVSGMAIARLIDNPQPVVRQKDSSDHTSYVLISNSMPFMIRQLSLRVSGPKFYEREARVYVLATATDSSGLYAPATSISLSSSRPAVFALPPQKAAAIIVAIDNKDNAPLTISGAATQQEAQYLIAWLETGKSYKLLAGSSQASPPQYDLSRFSDSIPTTLPKLSYGNFSAMQQAMVAKPEPAAKSYWLWVVIVASVGVLSLLTYKLMKEVKKGAGK